MATRVPVSSLGLGDVIQLDGETYTFATVKRINPDSSVQVVRPYIQPADFSYTGGVITYIGQEDFALLPQGNATLVRKGDPLK